MCNVTFILHDKKKSGALDVVTELVALNLKNSFKFTLRLNTFELSAESKKCRKRYDYVEAEPENSPVKRFVSTVDQ